MVEFGKLLPVLVALGVSGCGEALPPNVYPIAAEQVFAQLKESRLENLVMNRKCGVKFSILADPVLPSTINWRVVSSGQEHLRLTATLTALGPEQTRVDVSAWNRRYGDKAYNGEQDFHRPVLNAPILPALTEQIDSILDGREYEKTAGSDGKCILHRQMRSSGRSEGKMRTDDPTWAEANRSDDDRLGTEIKPGAPETDAGKPTTKVY